MPSPEKKTVLDLPLKVILTDEGTTVFIRQNKKLTKFKLADNAEEHGLLLERFVPSSIQRMLLIDYVSKIEIARAEFVSCRQEVMDLSKLVVFGILYRQFDSTLFSRILASDVIKRWNRANPASILDEKTRFNEGFLQSYFRERSDIMAQIKQELLVPIRKKIMRNGELLPDELNTQLLLSEKFIDSLRGATWFILSKFHDVEGYELIAKELMSLLSVYMEKAKVAEYVALMVIELAVNAENTNLRREAAFLYRGTEDPNAVLYDPGIRRRVVEELRKKEELVYVSWKIGGTSSSIGTQGRLQITLYNHEDEYQMVKDNIDAKKAANLRKKSLLDFYREIPPGEADTELGLYYLSYLSEACEKVGIKFESAVSQIKSSDTTVITLSFNI